MRKRSIEDSLGVCVIKRDNEDIEILIKRFKKKVNMSGLQRDLKLKSYYEKPSVKKKRKTSEARARMIRDAQKRAKFESERKRNEDDKKSWRKKNEKDRSNKG